MSTDATPLPATPADDATIALVERLYRAAIGALDLYTVYLGEQLGLYRALADAGSATSTQLAEHTGTTERLVREWLEHHASGGLITVDDATAEPLVRSYRLPAAHIPVLADPESVHYEALRGFDILSGARSLPRLVEVFRKGGALQPPPLPPLETGDGDVNRALYVNLLGKAWLPAIPEVDLRLRDELPARVADIACGAGWSSIAMAQAYPGITVDGFDRDASRIAAATRHAAKAGVSDRVTFSVLDAAEPGLSGPYDLLTILEALHDMPRPVEVLAAARALLADGGSVLVVDAHVEDHFSAPASDRDRLAYGWSVLACLPEAMGDPETAATGAVMRPATLRRYAMDAGFRDMEISPIDNRYFRVYRLIP
jgi:2-polyprenyl-3-methyl-5-hydroxy-6-metoxy-1,4-benzoquinol methylase